MSSSPHYSITLSDPFGTRLADASNFISLAYSRVVNDIGKMTLILPGTFDTRMIRIPDGRIEIWRKQPGTSRQVLETDTIWLTKKLKRTRDAQGRVTLTIEAHTPLCILKEPGRFVDVKETVDPSRTEALDDMIKNIVRQNAGIFATAARDLSAYITVAPNLTLAPSTTKEFPWRSVLKTIQECAAASTQAGTYLAFDIVSPTPDTMEFRTYTQQRGVDHRWPNGQNPVIVGPAFGSVGECELEEDYSNEVTYVLAGGKGDLATRATGSAQDNTKIAASPFGRREFFAAATEYDTTTGLAAEAQAVLRERRVRATFRGRLLDSPGARYGVQWGWGDYLTVQAFDRQLDCRVEAIAVQVTRGKRTVDAVLRGEV